MSLYIFVIYRVFGKRTNSFLIDFDATQHRQRRDAICTSVVFINPNLESIPLNDLLLKFPVQVKNW